MQIVLRKINGRFDASWQRDGSTASVRAGAGSSFLDVLLSPFVLGVLLFALLAVWMLLHPMQAAAQGPLMFGVAGALAIDAGEAHALVRRFAPEFAEQSAGEIPHAGHQLQSLRAGAITAARAILDKAEKEKRELKFDERAAYDVLLAMNSDYSNRLELRERERGQIAASMAGNRRSDTPVFFDGEKEVRAVRFGERLAEVHPVALPDGIRAESLSLGRAVRALGTGNWKGAEAEQRIMGFTVSTGGGFLVPGALALPAIDLARNQARVIQAGAITVPVDRPRVTLAIVKQDPTAEWHNENAPITASDQTYGQHEVVVRTVAALCKMSVEVFEDAPNLPHLVEQGIASALGLAIDLGCLRGTGVGITIPGVRSWDGIQTISMGTNGAALSSYDVFSRAATLIANVNGPSAEGINIIYAPRTAGNLDLLKDGEGLPLRGPASWDKMGKFVTNQIPTNLTKGSSTDASEAYVADWSSLLVAMRSNLMLEISREAGDSFANMQVWIRAYLRATCVVTRPERFVLIDGIRAA